MYVVSANYRNRKSEYKWLVRKMYEPIESAKAYKRVIAHNGSFVRSSEAEEGFGCRVVAECESVETFDPEIVTVQLEFDGYQSFHDENGRQVERFAELRLDDEMNAVL